MLLSLALFAVGGGAMAYKSKFILGYCTTDIPGGGLICAQVTCTVLTFSTTNMATDFKCYTTPVANVPITQKCPNNCIGSTRLRLD